MMDPKTILNQKLYKWQVDTEGTLSANAPEHTRKLKRSIDSRKISSGSSLSFEFSYYLYGKFVDMNVGKGRSTSSKGEARMLNRLQGIKGRRTGKKNTWYQSDMYRAIKRLEGIVANYYGDEFVNNINKLPRVVEL